MTEWKPLDQMPIGMVGKTVEMSALIDGRLDQGSARVCGYRDDLGFQIFYRDEWCDWFDDISKIQYRELSEKSE